MVITEDPDSDSHQSPIALPVNFLPFNLHPSTAVHQVTEYIMNAPHRLNAPLRPSQARLSHPNVERLLSVFQLARDIACCPARRVRVHEGSAEL